MCKMRLVVIAGAIGFVSIIHLQGVSAFDGDPEAVALLEANGIVRGAKGFVLKSEGEVRTKLYALRTRVHEYEIAQNWLAEIEQGLAEMPLLRQRSAELRAQMADLGLQMGQFPATNRGGRIIHGANLQDDDMWKVLKAQRDACDAELIKVNLRLETLQNQGLGQRLGAAKEAYKLRREETLRTLGDLRENVDKALKGYRELSESAEVTRALEKLDKAKFGQSVEFLSSVRELERFERLASTGTTAVPAKKAPAKMADKSAKNQPPAANASVTYYERAYKTEKNGQIKGAITLYKDVIRDFPESMEAKKAAERIKAMTSPTK
jgi:TolA-binding protein